MHNDPIVATTLTPAKERSSAAARPGNNVSPTRRVGTSGLVAALRDRIRSGFYPEGSWLPAERDLSDEFGVARRTVRSAIDRLAQEGLLHCRPRFRPIVQLADPPAPITRSQASDSSDAAGDASAGSGAGERLVALVMWHGAPEERGATAQQRIFWGLNERLARDGFHGIFLNLGESVGSEQENAEREAARLRYALDHNFAGVVFYAYAYRRNRQLIQETARRLPLVLIDRMIAGIQTDFVGVDNHGAMYAATQHLISLGHQRILYVTNPESINTVQDRFDGYREAMAEAPGGPLSENVLTALHDWNISSWPVFEGLFRLPPVQRPTAVLCVSDYVALNVHRRLLALGLRVPEDVALVGFDGIVPFLPGGLRMTTVAQPFEEIGRAAAEAFLARRTNAAQSPCHIELPAHLVVHASSDPTVVDALPFDASAQTRKDLSLVSLSA